MKKLFTNDYIILDNYLSEEVCQRWEKKILSHLDIFGADVEPAYGQMAAYYGMIEAGLNESYYRFAEKHNKYLLKEFPEVTGLIADAGRLILSHSGLRPDALPVVPRDKKYFQIGGFNLQLHTWNLYNIHTDTEGLLQYPASIFDEKTRAYSCVVSIKRTAQLITSTGRTGVVVLNAAPPPATTLLDDARTLAEATGLRVARAVLRERSAYRAAWPYGLGVIEHEPKGKAALEIAALQKHIFDDVMNCTPANVKA